MNALSRVPPLVSLGLAELEAVVPVDEEEADVVVGVEAVVPEVGATSAFLTSIVKVETPMYSCTLLSPTVVVVRSLLERVKVPVSDGLLPELTVKSNPPLSDLATETVYVPHRVSLTAGRSPLSLVPDTSQLCPKSGLLLATILSP